MNTPTPETDAFIGDQDGTYMTEGEIAMCDFARRLERERDEARAERDLVRERALDAADVLQGAEEERDELRRDVAALLNALPNGAHDVTEGVVIIQAMRAAVKEAQTALLNWRRCGSGMSTDFTLQSSAFRDGQVALAKLQSFTV